MASEVLQQIQQRLQTMQSAEQPQLSMLLHNRRLFIDAEERRVEVVLQSPEQMLVRPSNLTPSESFQERNPGKVFHLHDASADFIETLSATIMSFLRDGTPIAPTP